MVPDDTLRDWMDRDALGDPPLIDREGLKGFFSVQDPIRDLRYITSEDDDPPEGVGDWINNLIESAVVPMPHISDTWNLLAGGLNDETSELPYVLYVAGQGSFDSSFPLLIFRAKDASHMASYGVKWALARQPTDPA